MAALVVYAVLLALAVAALAGYAGWLDAQAEADEEERP